MSTVERTLTVDPSPNAPRHHVIRLYMEIPTYGKPSDDMKTAQGLKSTMRVGVHSRATIKLVDAAGEHVEVPDREFQPIE